MKALVLSSGGIDSTTCIGIAVDKLGKENVITASLYYGQKHNKELECAKKVAEYYKIRVEDFTSKKRTKQIAYPRQIAMYLCREMTNLSLPKIGELFGGRDHSTVIHACEKIADELRTDQTLQVTVNKIKSSLTANS